MSAVRVLARSSARARAPRPLRVRSSSVVWRHGHYFFYIIARSGVGRGFTGCGKVLLVILSESEESLSELDFDRREILRFLSE